MDQSNHGKVKEKKNHSGRKRSVEFEGKYTDAQVADFMENITESKQNI